MVEVKGPLGTGLGITSTGRHVAFAAGTGILAFIDLVGHLILRLADFPIEFCEPLIDLDKFQFVLYSCFSTPADSIGFDLIHTLLQLCKDKNKPNLFIHYPKFT